MRLLSGFRALVWPESPDRAERVLVRKVDFLVLSYLCLQYCVNFINAYVSGMKVALDMQGREYNAVIACFTVGFAVAQIPQNLLLLVVPPRILFPLNGVIWGALTAVTAAAKNVRHLYVIKFFQGMAEASTFVGAHYILGSWYKPFELGKRAAIFSASAQAAQLFSGSLQATLYANLNGASGLAGWQYQFLICGVMTIPIAFYGLFMFPDTPETTRSHLFTTSERELAVKRLEPFKNTKKGAPMDFTLVKRVLGRWHLWAMGLVWTAGGALELIGTQALMSLWMMSQRTRLASGTSVAKYTVHQMNYDPLGLPAVAIASLLLTSVWTDRTGKRYQVNLVVALALLVSAVLLIVDKKLPTGVYYFAFYLSGVSFAGQMSNFAWASELCADDDQERGVVVAGMNVISYAFNSWFGVVFFPASSAPRWTQGYSLILAFVPLQLIFTLGARWMQLREQRRRSEVRRGVEELAGDGVAGLAREQDGAVMRREGSSLEIKSDEEKLEEDPHEVVDGHRV
ncbi:hypothetical protein JCM1840_005550 [Sporobolomyces johnsonii]